MTGRRLVIRLITISSFCTILFAVPQAGRDGAVDVVLIDDSTSALAGGTVVLQGPSAPPLLTASGAVTMPVQMPPEQSAVTGRDGHARFRELAPGQYTIRARKDGYVNPVSPAQYMAPFASAAVLVQSGQPVQEIELSLSRGATISGKITDADGSPVSGAQVYSGVVAYQNGRRTMVSRSSARTDDRGDYRLFWFGPGDYYIFSESLPRAGLAPEFSRTFYPDTTEFKKATPVKLTGATDASGIDIRLQTVKTFRVKGRVLDLPADSIGPGRIMPNFTYVTRDPTAVDIQSSVILVTRTNPETGEFEIAGIPPGSWNLFALLMQPGMRAAAATRSSFLQYLAGRAAIDVKDKDIEDVKIVLYGVDVKGKVVMPNSTFSLPTGFSIENTRISLQPRESMPSMISSGLQQMQQLGRDGEFGFRGVPPGKYGITVSAPLSITDILVGSKSIFNDGIINVGTESPGPITVILGERVVSVSGMLLGITPQTTVGELSSVRVVLVPDPPRRQNVGIYRSVELSSLRGNFFFSGVSPGSYKIFAVEGLRQGAEMDPEFLARYERSGRPVVVPADQSLTSVQVRWIRKTNK